MDVDEWIVEYELEISLDHEGRYLSTVLYMHDRLGNDTLTLFYGDGSNAGTYDVSDEIKLLDDLSGSEFMREEKFPGNHTIDDVIEQAAEQDMSNLFEDSKIGSSTVYRVHRRVIKNGESLIETINSVKNQVSGFKDLDEVVNMQLNESGIDGDVSELENDYRKSRK